MLKCCRENIKDALGGDLCRAPGNLCRAQAQRTLRQQNKEDRGKEGNGEFKKLLESVCCNNTFLVDVILLCLFHNKFFLLSRT